MARFVLLTLALVASASASFIPATMRQVVAEDVIGNFRSASSLGSICPRNITHSATYDSTEEPFTLPHSVMTLNKRRCGDQEAMTVYLDAQAAKDAVTTDELKTLIDDYVSTEEKIIFGVELEGRRCGGDGRRSFFSKGTLVMLLNPVNPVQIGITLLPGKVYMIVDDPELPGNCIYTKIPTPPEETPGPEVEPTFSPEPMDPATVTPAPGGGDGSGGPGAGGVGGGTGNGGGGDGTGDGTGDGGDDLGEESPGPSESPEDGGEGVNGEPSSSPEDDGSVCFPADASVELEDGSVKKMSTVELGDRVKVAEGLYSDVFMFTHKDASAFHDFVRISTVSGAALTATRGHYIYINGGFAAAGSAKVGDVLELGNGARTVVDNVSVVKGTGLFNPQTVHGDIIVNSIRASTFTRTIEPSTAQAMLAPLRLLYETFGFSPAFLDNGADMIASVLPTGQVAL